MSREVHNPFADQPVVKDAVASEVAAKKLLGDEGVNLFQKINRGRYGRPAVLAEDSELKIEDADVTALKESRRLNEDEFVLELSNATRPPSVTDLMQGKEYGFVNDSIANKVKLPYMEMGLREEMIDELDISDQRIRHELLSINQVLVGKIVAKVVRVEDLSVEYLDRYDSIMSADFIKVMDREGYRPATYKELLAYVRSKWMPEEGVELSDEEVRQHADVKKVSCLGSVLKYNQKNAVPSVTLLPTGRILSSEWLKGRWIRGQALLFVRKSS